jgi:hypothetical protein
MLSQMIDRLIRIGTSLAAALACASASAADTSNARCSTTDDGVYCCQFRMTDDSGSFEITAPGKPKYILNITEPGVAYGFMDLDGNSVPLPGQYLRSGSDRACWRNDSTGTEICAW